MTTFTDEEVINDLIESLKKEKFANSQGLKAHASELQPEEISLFLIKARERIESEAIETKYAGKILKSIDRIFIPYNKSKEGMAVHQKNQKKYDQSAKGQATRDAYNKSKEGKEMRKKFSKTDKGKATIKRYRQGDKGKIAIKKGKELRTGKQFASAIAVYEGARKEGFTKEQAIKAAKRLANPTSKYPFVKKAQIKKIPSIVKKLRGRK